MKIALYSHYLKLFRGNNGVFTLFIFVFCISCNNKNEPLKAFLDKKFPAFHNGTVIIIPGGGCTGCITSIERQADSLSKIDTIRLLYTRIKSIKLLKLQLNGMGIMWDARHIHIDSMNNYEKVTERYSDLWAYPTFIRLKNNKIELVSKYSIY